MNEISKIDKIEFGALPEALQAAYEAYFSLFAGIDENHPKNSVAFIWKKQRSTIDLSEHAFLKKSQGWHFETVHPDIADDYIKEKIRSGFDIKVIVSP